MRECFERRGVIQYHKACAAGDRNDPCEVMTPTNQSRLLEISRHDVSLTTRLFANEARQTASKIKQNVYNQGSM